MGILSEIVIKLAKTTELVIIAVAYGLLSRAIATINIAVIIWIVLDNFICMYIYIYIYIYIVDLFRG